MVSVSVALLVMCACVVGGSFEDIFNLFAQISKTGRQTDRQTDRHACRQSGRQTVKQADRQTNLNTAHRLSDSLCCWSLRPCVVKVRRGSLQKGT